MSLSRVLFAAGAAALLVSSQTGSAQPQSSQPQSSQQQSAQPQSQRDSSQPQGGQSQRDSSRPQAGQSQRDSSQPQAGQSQRDSSQRQSQSQSSQQGSANRSTLSTPDQRFVENTYRGNQHEIEVARMGVEKATNPQVKQFAQRLVDDHTKALTELQDLARQKGMMLGDSSDASHAQSSSTNAQSTSGNAQSSSSNNAQSSSGKNAQSSSANAQSSSGNNGQSSSGRNAQSSSGNAQSMSNNAHSAIPAKLSNATGAAFDKQFIQMMIQEHQKDIAAFEKESQSGADSDVKSWATKTLPTLREHLQQAKAIKM